MNALGLRQQSQTNGRFTDVVDTKWYADAVNIASEYDLVSGYKADQFAPMRTITRQETAVMVARAMELTGIDNQISDKDAENLLMTFDDGNKISAWARSSVAAAVKTEIMEGYQNQFNGKDCLTRAEAAVIVQRLLAEGKLI